MRAERGLILSTDEDGGEVWSLRPLRRELAPVANTPLIARELQALQEAGIREVGIVSEAGLVTAARDAAGEAGLDVDLIHIDPPAEAGLARRLLAAEPFIGGGPFVANIAGSLTRHDFGGSVEHLVRNRLSALAVLAKPERRTPANANAFVFGRETFDAARAAIDAQPYADVGVTEVLAVLAEEPGHVQVVPPTGWSEYVAGVEDLLEVNRLVLHELGPAAVPAESPGNRIMGPVFVDETATVESSVLNGPLAIAGDACITDAYVGPYTAIGAGATIDGAEIERSVVLPAASIGSVGFRIEGSVIGVNARVTRQLFPPRALRLWVGQDAHVSLA